LAVQEHNLLIDFLELDIEDDGAIMDILSLKVPVAFYLNLGDVFNFIKDWNEEYCSNYDLCPECRAKLVEMFVDVPYGDTTVQECEGSRCPYCGY
jgi:DNA-directed RNA polymerase subunit RPC12/RpoP